jgi:hypothetical protein
MGAIKMEKELTLEEKMAWAKKFNELLDRVNKEE